MPVIDNFKDVEQASYYQKCRPRYPDSLYQYVIGLLGNPSGGETRHRLAVDVGCGSGQATIPLASYFDRVIGVDPSDAQINEAKKDAEARGVTNITYRVGQAEHLDFLENESVNIITVGTALHWFDLDKFCVECLRVLRPGGVVIAYSYGLGDWTALGVDQANFSEVKKVYEMLVERYRDPQVNTVYDKYVKFVPTFEKYFSQTIRDEESNKLEWTYSLDGLKGFLKSMSMYQKYKKTLKEGDINIVDASFERLAQSYPGAPPEEAVLYSSEIVVLVGRK